MMECIDWHPSNVLVYGILGVHASLLSLSDGCLEEEVRALTCTAVRRDECVW